MGTPNVRRVTVAQGTPSAPMQPHESSQQQVSFSSNDRSTGRIRHMHDVLSDPYHCAVLYYLQESHGPADVCEVAEQVLTWCRKEEQVDGEGADQDRRLLLESHISSMEEFGLIRYDREQETIRLTDEVSITLPSHWEE